MKKIIILILCLSTLVAFTGCGSKDDEKAEKPEKEAVSQKAEDTKNEADAPKEEEQDPVEKVKADIVGTWVVEKSDVYESPWKAITQQIAKTYYYPGAEYEFTADGIFRKTDGTLTSNYEILSDSRISMKSVVGDNTGNNENDFELNGDEFILYGDYYDDTYSVPLGRAGATYFRRK